MKASTKIIISVLIMTLLVLAVADILVLSNKFTGKAISNDKEILKIGAIFPLTGASSEIGQDNSIEAELAKEELKRRGINIELIIEDSKGDSKEAVTSASKLINLDKIDVLLTVLSGPSSAVAPIAEENKIPQIYISPVNEPAEKYDYVFKDFIDVNTECKLVADGLVEQGYRKISTLMLTTATGKLCFNALKEELESKDASIVLAEEYATGTADFKTMLQKIKQIGSESIFLFGFSEVRNIIEQMKELNMVIPISCYGKGLICAKPDYISLFPDIFEGAVSTTEPFNIENPSQSNLKRFTEQFKSKYNRKLSSAEAIYTYDDIIMLGEALNNCGKNKECIKHYLLANEFNSITGIKLKFNNQGLIFRQTRLTFFKNGEWS